MAKPISSKVLFITTSPRTPEKMIPEINLLNKHFAGKQWNKENQEAFMTVLKNEHFFNGNGLSDPAFSARDRINRSPKALGFVLLKPKISLTSVGETLISSKRKEDVFLRQLLKFQIPSPYHKLSPKSAPFFVKPYLELFRLIRCLGVLKFDELKIFGLQLIDYRKFDDIVRKIQLFREEKVQNRSSYKKFKREYFLKELREIYIDEIIVGETKTRESKDNSLIKFLNTKRNNMRDYADACVRYLRSTGMVNISHVGKSLSIIPEKISELDYIFDNTDRSPVFIDDESQYIDYLCNPSLPKLLTDNKELLLDKIRTDFPLLVIDPESSIDDLKEILSTQILSRKETIMQNQVTDIKKYRLYDDIQDMFDRIQFDKSLYDTPLLLEWNTWRAMSMLNGGKIKANLKFDDFGNPMSTAQGNMPDIICDYEDFGLSVEVTMSSGQRQYEMESEPVSRHLGKLKKKINKPAYCLFLAPKINESCIAHFFTLHKLNITSYGGKSIIIPLEISLFQKMIEDSCHADYVPTREHVKHFFERSSEIANNCDNEKLWYDEIILEALNWLPTNKLV